MSERRRERRSALAAAVGAAGADALLVTRPVNVRYLTGLHSSNAAVLVRVDGPDLLSTDGRYAGTAEQVASDLELVIDRDTAGALVGLAADAGAGTLGFEPHDLTVERHAELAALDRGIAFKPLGHPVEELRVVKDEDEIALLRRACEITDEAFAALLPSVRPGITERALAIRLDRHMIDHGADGLAFDTIVASGPNGAIPHHSPGARELAAGDLVTFDFGALVGGYHADMTRTVAVGEPAAWQRDLYELVRRAQQAAVDAAVPGAEYRAVDAAARDLIAEAGFGDDFTHGLGHGVGLEIHEAPLMSTRATGKLVDRVPITAEPGVYLAGRGGVRIEDTLVARTGGPELLTKTTKDLLVL
ncbi:aminopeptidase P family protein [Actinomadura logoneensis]|uniref:Aminopeptidase P family protein n=1 Tax=Actinomadura logoneensis TaxID=2293572 RepID=A0A372JCI1_9ACTN|nr:Xaa-Pro peptidase family protein [Actinomadura logoneensis]RFU37544.1 aminopeptidase P family protein [Actinomadura logoneensis]